MRIFETCYDEISTRKTELLVDSAFTATAEEQARLLATRLKKLKFRGVIFSSPYDCAMRTANTIAEELGVTFKPLVCLRNILREVDDTFQGATAEELIKRYEFVEKDFELPLRWWGDKKEPLDAIINRLKTGLEPVLSKLPKDVDVLLVGHGKTSMACRHLFGVTKNELGLHYNCHLSLLYSPSGECYANDCKHLPEKMRTTATISYLGIKAKLEKEIETARRFYQENGGEKVMHIGDTHSWSYPYYKTLIEEIKPDVIVHTGDMVDEIKAGRVESVRSCWIDSAKVIAGIMEKSGARVIIVPGNNDLEEILKSLAPNSEILPRNTVIEFSGKKVLLCHEINKINNDLDAEVYLYGHGLTGETRAVNDNERNGKRYYNVSWGTSLHSFSKGKSVIFYRMSLNN